MSGWKKRSFTARLRFAVQGLAHALRAERSFQLQVLAGATVLLALVVLRPSPLWWALIVLACAGVLAAELLNTAIEQLADELHPADSPAIRIVKDCAAAGVLIAVLGALGVALALLVHLCARGPAGG